MYTLVICTMGLAKSEFLCNFVTCCCTGSLWNSFESDVANEKKVFSFSRSGVCGLDHVDIVELLNYNTEHSHELFWNLCLIPLIISRKFLFSLMTALFIALKHVIGCFRVLYVHFPIAVNCISFQNLAFLLGFKSNRRNWSMWQKQTYFIFRRSQSPVL